MFSLADIHYGNWHLGVNDPTFIGWFIFAGYFFLYFICRKAVKRHNSEKDHAFFWFTVTIAMLLLGINKQLDFQTLVIEMLRDMEGEIYSTEAVNVDKNGVEAITIEELGEKLRDMTNIVPYGIK